MVGVLEVIKILSVEQSVQRYGSYTKVAHHANATLFVWHKNNLLTHDCKGDYVEHNVFTEDYDISEINWQGCGRYCPKEKVICVYDYVPINSRVRRLVKKFPDAKLIATF